MMNKKSQSQDCADAVTEIDRKMSRWIDRYQNLPEGEKLPVHNENRASTLKGEIAQMDETLQWVEAAMLELDSKHERYLCNQDGVCIRHRDSCSVENTEMMFGPNDPCLEDWMAVLRNDLLDCRNDLHVELSRTEKGDVGEENVFHKLYSHYPTLSNIVLDVADNGGTTNETDFYAILPHGVAVIEVKNYGKSGQQIWIKDASHTSSWELTTAQGRHLDDKKNPFFQNDRHIEATRKVLKGLLNKEIPLFSVVVLGNNQVQIMNDTDLLVTNPRGLCSALDDLTSDVTLSEQEQGIIMRHLQSLDIGSRAFECLSYRKRNEHIYQLVREIFPVLCDNKAIRTRYYEDRKRKENRLAAVLISIPVLVAILFRSTVAIIACLLCMCLLISAVAVLLPKLRRFFPGLGMPKRDELIQKICQEQNREAASVDPHSREARLADFNRYLLTGAERYSTNFDVAIPLHSLPERYIPFEKLKEEIVQTRERSAAYVREHFDFEDFDLFDFGAIYEMTGSELTLGFQMVRHMCNQSVAAFVGLNEAEQYYKKCFEGASMFSACLNINVLQYESGPKIPVEELPLLEELGVNFVRWCRKGDNEVLISYRDELVQMPKILAMLAECHRYAQYLLELGSKYYEYCGVVVNDEGEVFEVSDWNQTFENFRQLLINHQHPYGITSAEFLSAVV